MDRRGKIMWVNEEKIKKRELSLMFENEKREKGERERG